MKVLKSESDRFIFEFEDKSEYLLYIKNMLVVMQFADMKCDDILLNFMSRVDFADGVKTYLTTDEYINVFSYELLEKIANFDISISGMVDVMKSFDGNLTKLVDLYSRAGDNLFELRCSYLGLRSLFVPPSGGIM